MQSSKRCLRKILGKAKLTYEELLTIIAEVEGVLNSRPLCHIYDDNIDDVITPSHLLFGRRLLSPSYENVTPENICFSTESVAKRAQFINTLLEHFWKRWSKEYLTELREHQNCRNKIPDKQVQVGDVVLIHDNLPRNRWKMGLVLELYEGKDGFKRGCKLRTLSKTGRTLYLNRPINKLYPLEIRNENTIKCDEKDSHEDEIQNEDEMIPNIHNYSNEIQFSKNKENSNENIRPRRIAADKGILKRLQCHHV